MSCSVVSAHPVSVEILDLLQRYRRTTDDAGEKEFLPQLERLDQFVTTGQAIVLTLPAFPCKSPNPAKVLGQHPDAGERLSLRFLNDLCARIAEIHPTGARVVICSDGHVFGDLIGVPDQHIDEYSAELRDLIKEEGLSALDTFDLRDALGEASYDEKRRRIEEEHAPTLDEIRTQVREGGQTLRLYRGITRFLLEDAFDFNGSRSALQRRCRERAYGVVRRSAGWGSVVEQHFPEAVRLSIHPQPAGSTKFGIRLLDAPDVWMTPWHSCVVQQKNGRTQLMPRAQAETLGTLVTRNGRPDHFRER